MLWMRVLISALLLFTGAQVALAQAARPGARALAGATPMPEPQKAQLDAAIADARASLRLEVLSYPLAPGLDVRHFLDRTTGVSEDVARVIQDAPQRGGPRWTTDQTCEILLELPGSDLVPALQKIENDNPTRLPVRKEAIDEGIDGLKGQTFTAMGKSTGSANLMRLRPGAWAVAWRDVKEADRREAVATARNNAVARVVQSLRPVPLGDGKTMDEALNDPQVSGEIRDWVGSRPVTDVVFGDDLDVRLTLSAPPQELWPAVEGALRRHHLGPRSDDAKAWAGVRDAVYREAAPAVGRGVAAASPPPAAAANAAGPAEPPPWAGQTASASATAVAGRGGALKARGDAETAALQQVRAKVDALPLAGGATVGEAAKSNPRLARALDGAVRRQYSTKVSYLPKGVVKVDVSLDLEEVWRAFNSNR